MTQSVRFESSDYLLDPDTLARGLSPSNPSDAAIAAGREVLKRTADFLNRGVSFAVETTLSSRGRLELMRNAKSRGYTIHLVFIGLDSPERCITRIRNRVAHGGHFIPDADVRRRFFRCVSNSAQALQLADIAKFYDNSGDRARLILVAHSGSDRRHCGLASGANPCMGPTLDRAEVGRQNAPPCPSPNPPSDTTTARVLRVGPVSDKAVPGKTRSPVARNLLPATVSGRVLRLRSTHV